MCGIAGIVGNDIKEKYVFKMLDSLKRRGPDDNGFLVNSDKKVLLGQTRLSIIDVTERGHQPMKSKSGRFSIVFNGEIYNYRELKSELIKEGASFSSDSDTEVILWAWELWGEKTPCYLRGMFAFSIWDYKMKKLFLVRDRLGIKPLFYTKVNNAFIFGSTIQSIIDSSLVDKTINYESVIDFFIQGSVIQPKTIYKNISSQLPGSMMTIEEDFRITTKYYWDLKPNQELKAEYEKMDYQELVRITRKHLEEACKYSMTSDVPVGSFLSGGVDSTSITALLAKNSSEKINTFSIGFDNNKKMENELPYALMAANHIGTNHSEFILTGKDIVEHFDDFISVLDQPSNDGINTYFVSKMASTSLKVAFSGLGADEIFGGYKHFSWYKENKSISGQIKSSSQKFIYDNLGWPGRYKNSGFDKLNLDEKLSRLRNMVQANNIKSFLNIPQEFIYEARNRNEYVNEIIKSTGEDTFFAISKYEINNYLLNTLLRDSDALGMGNGLEIRPPFLDHFLVEHALSLPSNTKFKNGVTKAILKDSTKDLLPANFFERQKKGFTLPTSKWINTSLKNRFVDTMNSEQSKMILTDAIRLKFIDDSNRSRYNKMAYPTFVFLEWLRHNNITSL